MKRIKNLYQNNNPFLNDAFERVVAQIHIKKQKENLSSFVLCGAEPGVGTTSIAINLAISMANSGWKTILVDGDFRKIETDKRLNTENYGFVDYLHGEVELTEVICGTNYDMLDYIPNGEDYEDIVSMLCSANMQEAMNVLEQSYDYVIIDCPSLATAVDASIVANISDAVVLITSQSEGYTVKAVRDAKKKLDNADANILGIIVNQVDSSEYRRAIKNYDYFNKHRYKTKKEKKKSSVKNDTK